MKHGPLLAWAILVAAAMPMAAQVPTGPQLEIVSIDIQGGPQWVHGEPANGIVAVTLRNDGNAPAPSYRIDYHWIKDGEATWLNGQEQSSFDIPDETLSASEEEEQPPMPWRLQPGQEGEGTIRVTVTMGTDETHDTKSQTVFVPVHDVEISIDGDDQLIHGDETRFVRVEVTNHGNEAESVALDTTAHAEPENRLDDDIRHDLQYTQLDVAPGATGSSTLFVDYTFSGDQDDFIAWYDINATTGYGRTLQATTPIFEGNHTDMPSGSPTDLARVGDSPLTVPVADALEQAFTLTNTGADNDTYRVAARPATGWQATVGLPGLPDASEIRLALRAGESIEFRMTVSHPDEAPLGTPADIGINVTSDRPLAPTEDLYKYRVEGPALRIEAAPTWQDHPYVGDAARAAIVLSNDGDAPTPEGTLDVSIQGADDIGADFPAPVIAPGEARTLILDIDNHTTAGEATFHIGWTTEGEAVHVQDLRRNAFVHGTDIQITSPDSLAGTPGELVGYRTGDHVFHVENNGNAEEMFLVRVASDAGTAALAANATFALAPGEGRSVPIDQQVPGPSGALEAIETQLTVRLQNRPDLSWSANVTTHVEDQSAPQISMPEIPALWTVGEPLPIEILVADDSRVESVELVHQRPDGDASTFAMIEGDGAWRHNIPSMSPGNHTITFRATDFHGNEAQTSASTLEARSIPPPTLTLEGPSPASIVTPDAIFHVHVEDDLPILDITVTATNATGTVWQQELAAVEGNASFDLAGSPNGSLTLVVEAVNGAGARGVVSRTVIVEIPAKQHIEEVVPDKDSPAPGALAGMAAAAIAVAARRMPRGRTRRDPMRPLEHPANRRIGRP